MLLMDLTTYIDVNQDVGKAAMTRLQGYPWDGSEVLVALAFFDPWSQLKRISNFVHQFTPKWEMNLQQSVGKSPAETS